MIVWRLTAAGAAAFFAACLSLPSFAQAPAFGSAACITDWTRPLPSQDASGRCAAVVPRFGFPSAHKMLPPALAAHPDGEDYVNDEIANHAMHWDHMPVSVFIATGGPGFRAQYERLLVEAMKEWTKAGAGKVGFVQVMQPALADVLIDWVAGQPRRGDCGNTESVFALVGGVPVLRHIHVDLGTAFNGRQVSDREMMKTCLHELGHALGLQHSHTRSDIMYWQSNPAQSCALGPRDARTIQRWYGG